MSLWTQLALPWQACLEQAWIAQLAGSLPIGAAITDENGAIVGRARNRINDSDATPRQTWGNELAHAELNALMALGERPAHTNRYTLYTTTEPCPLCMGALYMSGVRNLRYASRDPWAGSANLLGTTPYLSYKPVKAIGPENARLEIVIMAWFIAYEHDRFGERPSKLYEAWGQIVPDSLRLGKRWHREGVLKRLVAEKASTAQVVDSLAEYE